MIDREKRKMEEYHMARVRTVWATVTGCIAVLALICNIIILVKVHGG